jgi:hypothetical protein
VPLLSGIFSGPLQLGVKVLLERLNLPSGVLLSAEAEDTSGETAMFGKCSRPEARQILRLFTRLGVQTSNWKLGNESIIERQVMDACVLANVLILGWNYEARLMRQALGTIRYEYDLSHV